MADEKKLKAMETINRALGWLEGVSYGLESSAANCIMDAVEAIENALKEVFENG